MSEQGLIHIYFGNGKGKTTAALGLALRASGCGKSVVVVQFLKDWKSGELAPLASLPGVTILRGKAPGGVFVHEMDEEAKRETKSIHDSNLKQALDMQREGKCDLLVLDEAIDAYRLGLLDEKMFNQLLDGKPEPLELVITGHNPDASILERADYVTEMVKHKHPYDLGVAARKGVEF